MRRFFTRTKQRIGHSSTYLGAAAGALGLWFAGREAGLFSLWQQFVRPQPHSRPPRTRSRGQRHSVHQPHAPALEIAPSANQILQRLQGRPRQLLPAQPVPPEQPAPQVTTPVWPPLFPITLLNQPDPFFRNITLPLFAGLLPPGLFQPKPNRVPHPLRITAAPLSARYTNLFSFNGFVEWGIQQDPYLPDVRRLKTFDTVKALLAHNPMGFTTSLGAHVELKQVQHSDALHCAINLRPVGVDERQSPRQNHSQHVRDAMMLFLQMGINKLVIPQDAFTDSKIGFLLSWAEAHKDEAHMARDFEIKVQTPDSKQSAKTIFIGRDEQGEVSIEGEWPDTPDFQDAVFEHDQWLQAQIQQPGEYKPMLDLVNRHWEHNLRAKHEQSANARELDGTHGIIRLRHQ